MGDTLAMTRIRELSTDVVIAGSGTAGSIAALAAAREGVRVILIERDFAPGGTGTRGGIHSYYHGSHGGLQDELDAQIKGLEKTFGIRGGNFHPEAKRVCLDQRLTAAGVRVLYQTIVCGVQMNGEQIEALRCADENGLLLVRGTIVVDSTGDGDVAAAAGARFTFGRQFDGASHQYSLVPRRLLQRSPRSSWEVSFDNYDAGWVDPHDPWDVSRALIEGRLHMHDYYETAGLPEQILGVGTHLGVREGRHIEGDHVIRFMDFMRGRTYPDVVCTANSHYDNHARDMANEDAFSQAFHVPMAMYRRGTYCHIPFRSLLARGIGNLLVACRAFSTDRETSLAIRMQRDMQKVGEAAGVAAALAVKEGVALRSLNIRQLQAALVGHGLMEEGEWERECFYAFTFKEGPLAAEQWNAMHCQAEPQAYATLLEPLTWYFGTREEGKALWWIYLLAKLDHSLLAAMAADPSLPYPKRRGAAFALAMVGDKRAIDGLLECLRAVDSESPQPSIKSYPRWVAALVFLRQLKAAQGASLAITLLGQPQEDRFYSFLLAYLHDITPQLSEEERARLRCVLAAFEADDSIGRACMGQGERSKKLDLRWNLDMWVYRLYLQLGDEAVAERYAFYAEDGRPFVRRIWRNFLNSVRVPAVV